MAKNPNKFSSKFVFNPAAPDDEVIIEKRKRMQKIESLIEDLKAKVTMCGSPIFTHLITYFPPEATNEEIEILGKALQKYATLKPKLDALKKELQVIDIARDNMHLLASVFADSDALETEIDSILTSLGEGVKTNEI